MTASKPCPTRLDLRELIDRANAAFASLSPSQKLRHRYMQRRSMARGLGASATSYDVHCANVDKLMPHETTLTDTQIGLILVGEKPGEPQRCTSCDALSLQVSILTNERDEARALARCC